MTSPDTDLRAKELTKEVVRLTRTLHEALAAKPQIVQGAALADCFATLLAGHRLTEGDEADLYQMRKETLDRYIKLIWTLVPLADQRIDKQIEKELAQQ